ncbi:restriction endonuclease subunit S [Gillisia sp. Hel_I_29]|uniref:restriction endonuclease subunit S n=1 Tax=Gillisia sp. Hel_I_29 TaxID=1249975 RepID=UPI00054FA942|nr:restriction endonuclease subunit S [Gillisia sp. Hel_I_29]
MYSLSPNIDNKKAFLINKSEIKDRIDPIYFKSVNELIIANKTTFKLKKLSEVAEMQRGRFGHRPRNDPKFYGGEYPFIQTGDIVRASNEGGTIKYTQTLNELGIQTSRLFDKPVMVITIAANIGDTAILDFPACFPDSLIGITPKDSNALNLYYLNVYFKFLKNYLNDLAPQAAQKNINYQQLGPTPIVIPPINVQEEIAFIYSNAFKLKKEKEKEANMLLENIDKYLLAELGIILPTRDNSYSNRVFEVNWSEVSGDRFDAFSFFNNALKIEGGNFPNKKLRELATVNKGRSITSANVIEGDYPVIAGGKTSPYSHNEYNNEGKTITVSASGAYSGYVWFHNEKIFASDCVVIKTKDESMVSLDYLSEILKLKQTEIYGLQQGAGQPHVYPSDLVKLNIPLPPLKVQNKIIEHIIELREKAMELKSEARSVWKEAKSKIEKMIIG